MNKFIDEGVQRALRNRKMSHNACSEVYDYSKLRWKVQPSDMVVFDDRADGCYVGEIMSLSRDLMSVKRLKDGRIFVISLYDIRDWRVKPCDFVRRLPHGVFQLGERVFVDGELELDCVYRIVKFEFGRVKVSCEFDGRFFGGIFFEFHLEKWRKNPETLVVSGFSEPISFSVRNVGS